MNDPMISVYIALTVAITQMFKPLIPDSRFYPFVSLTVGFVFGWNVANLGIVPSLMIGLTASGLYSSYKVNIEK